MGLDPENQDDYVWAKSAYCGEHFKTYLAWVDLKNRIHEKTSRNQILSADKTEHIYIRSKI